jgi:hypothetical protein
MIATTLMPSSVLPPAIAPRAIETVFLPKEHGSWSLALEPLVLGLLIAPSPAGGALATAAFAGFLARRPLKTALTTDRPARRRTAALTLAALGCLATTGLAEAAMLGGVAALWPLLLVAPLGGLFAYFDAQNEARAAAAEIVGCSAFALLPTALATLAGWSAPAALALALIAFTRSLPTVLTLRFCLRSAKGESPSPALAPVCAAIAASALAFAWSLRLVPMLSVAAATVLLLRSLWFTSPWRPGWPARRLGMLEAALGVLYAGTVAAGYHAG